MIFRDRIEAGQLLARELDSYRDDPRGVILALPRGGVVVGYELGLALRMPLDVFITQKLSTADNPEYALGALSETGAIYLNPDAVDMFSFSHDEIESMIQAQRPEVARRRVLYRQGRALPTLVDRTVILVDDGIATGATFFATIEAITELSPRRIVAAIPVAPRDTIVRVRRAVDELIVLATPEPFVAVGHYYENFTQVEDGQVLALLKAAQNAQHSCPSQT